MRGEVEAMHQQQHRTSMSMIENDTMGNYDILETRLRQTTAEVSRLHKERRKLIDIQNSLQAKVNQV
jgi:predicted metal-dependent hydrolase